ncbi:MAG: DUF3492 domain-containing protein [Balneolaceae bacterium]|nr:DUF3492 domain-containing protein [Balneolaceae bacterium]
MIILVLEETYPWYRGGVSEWVSHYLGAFPGQTFSLLQLTTTPGEVPCRKPIYRLPDHVRGSFRLPVPVARGGELPADDAWASRALASLPDRALRGARLVHVLNTGFAGLLGRALASAKELPLVLTEHALYRKEAMAGEHALECGFELPVAERARRRMARWFRNSARKIYRSSHRVISVSRCNMPNQRDLGARDPIYIPNGVDASWLLERKVRSGRPTLGWIGRCAGLKDPLRFFRVMEQMDDEWRGLMMLSSAGEGELEERVRTEGEDNGRLCLVWDRPAREHIDQMDALCITSRSESQPLVLFEGLARRVLPAGWRVGDVGPPFALTVPKGSPPWTLAGRINRLWKEQSCWERALDSRRELLEKEHTWEAVFGRYRNVLEPWLDGSSPGPEGGAFSR